MTRKDYQLIADSINETRQSGTGGSQGALDMTNIVLDKFLEIIGSKLKEDNANFDYQRFADASHKSF